MASRNAGHADARVRCIDDDPEILRRSRAILEPRYKVRTHSSARRGLGVLDAEGSFAVLICDYQMPEMNDVEALSKAASQSAETVQILLTGAGLLEIAIEAINEGKIFRLLQKPVTPDRFIWQRRNVSIDSLPRRGFHLRRPSGEASTW